MSISLEAEKTTANHNPKPTAGIETAANARSWLEGLSPEECAAALCFRDGPFLASLLELAASSLASSPSSFSLVDGLTKHHAFTIEDLNRMSVDEKEWERSLSRRVEVGSAAEAEPASAAVEDTTDNEADEPREVHDLPTAEESIEKDEGEGVGKNTRKSGKAVALPSRKSGEESTEKAKEEADVFRIRGGVSSNETIKESSAASRRKGRSGKGDAKADMDEKSDNVERVAAFSKAAKDIAENMALVSPAAADTVGDVPFIALHPAFLKAKGTGECIRSLDNIIQTLSPSSGFLSPDFIPKEYLNNNKSKSPPPIEKICLQRVHSLMKAASDNNAPIMLFLIFLVRIEVAAFMAFADSKKGKGGKKKTGLPSPTKHNLEILTKRIEVLENRLARLDMRALETIMAPLTGAGYCSLEGHTATRSDTKLQNLCVIPLPTLIKLFASTDASNRFKFQSWNKAWNSTIHNLLEFCKFTTTSQEKALTTPTASTTTPTQNTLSSTKLTSTNTISDTATTTTATTPAKGTPSQSSLTGVETGTSAEATTPATTSSKKKKRKKKKNKKKNANTNANSNNNNNNTSGDASPPTSDERTPERATNEGIKRASTSKAEKALQVAGPYKDDAKEGTAKDNKAVHTKRNEATTLKAQGLKSPEGKASTAIEKTSSTEDSSTVTPARNLDAGKLNGSTIDETASTRSESTRQEETEADIKPASKPSNKGDFTVSRVHGVGTVVVAPSTTGGPSNPPARMEQKSEGDEKGETAPTDDNHDEWETVEVKGRGNRKKSGRANAQQGAAASNGGNSSQNGPKKSKSARTSAARKRVAHRKIVKDILSTVLDNVEEEVGRRRQQEARAAKMASSSSSAPAPVPTVSAWKDGSRGIAADANKKEKTLRDVVVGKKPVATPPRKGPQPASKGNSGNNNNNNNNHNKISNKNSNIKVNNNNSNKVVVNNNKNNNNNNNDANSTAAKSPPPPARISQRNAANASPLKGSKGQVTSADQNTAPTIPETVSAVSEPKRAVPRVGRDITRSDSSSADTDDNPKQEERASTPTEDGKTFSPEPPLPTLLNPGNVNSASSSVASSLEAPHASHGHRHTSTSNEVDVGYHLLDVCDRLTRDMHIFMARRASALSTRRRERGALLGALQDTVSSIWAGHSHVELYGSCATMLDLPSSDLDVVVCGLDQMDASMSASSPQHSVPSFSRSMSESITPDRLTSDPPTRHSMPHFVPMQPNSDRVIRLAGELERQPWAVHVKAIPTATVPVVKVLADPTRLPGAVPPSVMEGEEWMMQQQHHHHHHAASGTPPPNDFSGYDVSPASCPHSPHYQPIMAPVWRGADVINGLLQIDITFEGPEHGGIGSTEFSARVVQNVCDETGLVAESTAFVQVIMVVKELLAQRRLNEPFSGGLSSYALLLLVLAVMCERKVVREELERVEMQRRVVAAGGGNSELSTASSEKSTKNGGETQKTNNGDDRFPPGHPGTTSAPKSNAPTVKASSNGTPVSTSTSNANAPNGPKVRNGSPPGNSHGTKAAKNSPLAPVQQAPKQPQVNAQGAKQAGKNPTQWNTKAQGTKQGGKSPAESSTQMHGDRPKQPVKSSQQPGAQQARTGNQAKGGNPGGNQQRGNNSGVANQQRRSSAGGNQPRGGQPNPQKTEIRTPQSSDKPTKSVGNSWASIAMGKSKQGASNGSPAGKKQEASPKAAQPSKPSSFADAVARNTGNAKGKAANAASVVEANPQAPAPKVKPTNATKTTAQNEDESKRSNKKQHLSAAKTEGNTKTTPETPMTTMMSTENTVAPATESNKSEDTVSDQTAKVEEERGRKIEADEKTSKFNNYSSEPAEPAEPALSSTQSAFPQGFNDVIEVLCSGETTPGKLLMHFLLFYGQHFDAHATAIDISGKHHREIATQSPPYTHLSPYIQRRSAGSIDPVTGMLTVDPIVVYDPLEGAENNNVARRCFLWSSVKWVFAQSYMTLSSAAERNTTPPGTPGAKDAATGARSRGNGKQGAEAAEIAAWNGPYNPTDKGSLFDPSSPLLELLLSF